MSVNYLFLYDLKSQNSEYTYTENTAPKHDFSSVKVRVKLYEENLESKEFIFS